MSTREKLLGRLFSRPKDFEWSELRTLLTGYGYEEITGSGSRVKFVHSESGGLIILHKPHPSPVIKGYILDRVIEELERRGIQP